MGRFPENNSVRRLRLAIVSYSFIARDARVRRQIEYLRPHHDLTAIGYGDPDPAWTDVTWHRLELRETALEKLTRNAFLTIRPALPALYDLYYALRPLYRQTYALLMQSGANAVHANDLSALPVCAEAARKLGAKLVFDAHEYAPLEQETPKFKRLETPARVHLLKRYAKRADAAITVCEPIAERYMTEFGFRPIVIMNAPALQIPPDHTPAPDRIRLIHHGVFDPSRGFEQMVEAVALADSRYELHFMFVGNADAIARFRAQAEARVPGRVFFHDPVPTPQVVETIAQYDAGIHYLTPSSYNALIALPNKFFDAIMAGHAVFIGASPAMKELAEQYGFGRAAASFDPRDLAALLNSVTYDDLIAMRAAARQARHKLNADIEMAKLVRLYAVMSDE
ncbi:MAG: hypothetical protein CUN53_00255 [Phototrophicales bacterium]|nr:MAG: hypothetical protein CUN53_00255 [Phototrophicales bacterium]